MVFTAVKASTFGTSKTIYGFRIDNTGNADPKFFGASDSDFQDNPSNPLISGISGYLFNDSNGMNNSWVDGLGIDKADTSPIHII